MADIDTDLRNRLARLAEAVPVASGGLDPVHRGAVEARQAARMAWITPLVVLVAVVVGATLLNGGNDPATSNAPATDMASPSSPIEAPDANGPIEVTDRDREFELTMRSAKTWYRPNEPIDVSATLTYLGTKDRIEITHDSTGPVMFGIQEKVFGEISVGGLSLLMCDGSTLERGVGLTEPFKKGGGFSGDHPDADKFKDWIMDPVLRLPTGTWHLSANAGAPCMSDGPAFSLATEITLIVSDDPAATPSEATLAPDIDEPVYGGDDIGDFQLQLKAGRSTYEAGEPIDISTWYAWGSGLNDSIVVSHFEPEVAFSIWQVADNAHDVRARLYDSACQELTLRDGEHRKITLTDANVMAIRAVTWPPSSDAALIEDALRLPIGRWRITAIVNTAIGPCSDRGEARHLSASIEIDVVGPENAEIELATGAVPTLADGTQMCLTARGGGVLATNPRTGLGFTDASGDVITDVIWPDGYTARYKDGRAILIDESGHIAANEGESMDLAGGYGDDDVFHVCGAGIAE